jgi:hypothetical protein
LTLGAVGVCRQRHLGLSIDSPTALKERSAMKLGYMLELTLAVAVGLTLALGWVQGEGLSIDIYTRMTYSFIAGLLFVESIGVWIEKARRRGPSPWGFGRMTWSTLGGACLIAWAWDMSWDLFGAYGAGALSTAPFWFYAADRSWKSRFLVWIPLALIITTRLAGLPRDPKPDAREWFGRVFGILIMLFYIFSEIYEEYYSYGH